MVWNHLLMEPQNPEDRIADLERQLDERQQPEPVSGPVVTAQDVQNVAFSKPAIGQRGYNVDEVDAFIDRVAAALGDATERGAVTPADIRNVAFSKPPIGQRGYNEEEVDAFIDLVEIELTRRLAEHGLPPSPEGWQTPSQTSVDEESAASTEPIRCQLFTTLGKPWGAASLANPSSTIEVDGDAIRVIDANRNALIGSASLAQVTATAENYTYFERPMSGGDGAMSGGKSCIMPVLVVNIPGLEPLTIQPLEVSNSFLAGYRSRFSWRGKVAGVSEAYGEWAKERRPAYAATNAGWLTLVEKFALGTRVADASEGGFRITPVVVLAVIAVILALILWAVIH
jgi:DivIVA domain-containing protein